MICETCGSELPSETKFCPICGAFNPPDIMPNEVLNELEASLNPQELEEVEVVKPETLARWRTFVPEEIIVKILRQRIWAAEMRRAEELVTLPNIAYTMPRLPEIEKKTEVFATAIDTDGWIHEVYRGREKIGRIDRIIYRWEYDVPEIGFASETLELTEKFANMMHTSIFPTKPTPPAREIYYRTTGHTSRAIYAIYRSTPFLIKFKTTAQQILRKYRERPNNNACEVTENPNRNNYLHVKLSIQRTDFCNVCN